MRQKLTLFTLLLTIAIAASAASAQTTAKDFYEKGKAESRKGDFKAAGDDYTKAFDLDPASLPPNFSAAIVKMKARRNRRRIAWIARRRTLRIRAPVQPAPENLPRE